MKRHKSMLVPLTTVKMLLAKPKDLKDPKQYKTFHNMVIRSLEVIYLLRK